MGRIKKDHTGWRTHGIWLKYQTPTVNERPVKIARKKDTNKWCRGKVGVEHNWHRFQEMRWNWHVEDYVDPYVAIHCVECGKEKYSKTSKSATYPLHIWIDKKDCGIDPIQVRVNGQYKPLTIYDFKGGLYYCRSCGFCHG